jgi:Protein of unknown function (DUF3551)
MRMLFVFGILTALLAIDARREAAAQWCAYYDPYTYTCGFVSFNQCLATVSGVGGFCRRDPYSTPPARDDRRSPPPRRSDSRGNGY